MPAPIKYFLFLLSLSCCNTPLPAQQNIIDSLQNVLSSAKEDTNKVNILNNLAWEFKNTADFEKSINYAAQANDLSDKINYKKGKAKSLSIIGLNLGDQGNYQDALTNHFESLKINEESGDKKGMKNLAVVQEYISLDKEAFKGKLLEMPQRNQIPITVNERLIVEFYSR